MSYKLKILDFDIENRPLSYWAPDMPTAEITAIAWCWTDKPESMEVHLLGPESVQQMLEAFLKVYDEADMVTGHYIRVHDLPHINGALMEEGMYQLTSKLTCDTKQDMKKKKGIPATQEYLLTQFNLPASKYHMTQKAWREANRLTPEGIAQTKERVMSDVRGHILMREEMLKRRLLGAPRVWKP